MKYIWFISLMILPFIRMRLRSYIVTDVTSVGLNWISIAHYGVNALNTKLPSVLWGKLPLYLARACSFPKTYFKMSLQNIGH